MTKRYDLDATPNTLENALVTRIRSCWNKRPCATEYERNSLKDAINELHTFRTNRDLNPELHAKLDKEAVEAYKESGWLGYPQANWERFCNNKHILTRTRIDEPQQESLIEGMPVPAEKPKGRVREKPASLKETSKRILYPCMCRDRGRRTDPRTSQ